VDRGASVIHIKAGDVLRARIDSKVVKLSNQVFTEEETRKIALRLIASERDRERFDELRDYDTSWELQGVGRFRINILRQRGTVMVVMRVIPLSVPTLEELYLPAVLGDIAELDHGLVLITGGVGSGKSTTQAAMIQWVNARLKKHIITLEDPIEYLHADDASTVTQREIGVDTESFHTGLRAALRQDPDVVLIGEMRDRETMGTALRAAELGQLVISTLHTPTAVGALTYLLTAFPEEERELARLRLADARLHPPRQAGRRDHGAGGERPRGLWNAVLPTASSGARPHGHGRLRCGQVGGSQPERLRAVHADSGGRGHGCRESRGFSAVNLEGVFLPVTSPFDGASGELDRQAFTANIRAWCEHPIAGVLVGGSTGEAALLEETELLELVGGAARARPDGVAVIAGTGLESTRATIRLSRLTAAEGADAVLVKPPAYYRGRMTPEALRTHFLAIAEASPVPVILYHVPKFVPVDLVPDLVGELVRHDNIAGIKDSSADIHNLGSLCDACGDIGSVLVGAGTHLYSGLEIGACGGIIAVGLLATEAACELHRSWRAGRSAEAGRLQERIGPLHKKVVAGTGVPGVKHGLDLLGLAGGPPRPPLLPPSGPEQAAIATALERAGVARAAPLGC
jgi:pilus retraction protein PilT